VFPSGISSDFILQTNLSYWGSLIPSGDACPIDDKFEVGLKGAENVGYSLGQNRTS